MNNQNFSKATHTRCRRAAPTTIVPVGASLPLFGDDFQQLAGSSTAALSRRSRVKSNNRRRGEGEDPHMRAAWQISKALKGAGQRSRQQARLSRAQRHQLGGAVCGHLLASLRSQLEAEHASQEH